MTWRPNWVVPPGETLAEELQERGWSQARLARETGFSTKHINRVVKGHATLGIRFALALEEVFGMSAEFWLTLQMNYDLGWARGESQGMVEG